MQNQNFFQVKTSQIEAALGTEWNFLKNKSAEVPTNLLFHSDRRSWFDIFITLSMAFLGLTICGMLVFVPFTSSLNLDIWVLVLIILVILWQVWKFWQMQFHIFGKIPRKRSGFWLSKDYLLHIKNRQMLSIFPKNAIQKIVVSHKKIPNTNEGYNDKYIIEIDSKFSTKSYRYTLVSDGRALVQMLEQGNLPVYYTNFK